MPLSRPPAVCHCFSLSLLLVPSRLLPKPFCQGPRLSQWAYDGWWWVVEWGIVGTGRQGLNKEALWPLFRVAELLGVGYDRGGVWDAENGKLNIE